MKEQKRGRYSTEIYNRQPRRQAGSPLRGHRTASVRGRRTASVRGIGIPDRDSARSGQRRCSFRTETVLVPTCGRRTASVRGRQTASMRGRRTASVRGIGIPDRDGARSGQRRCSFWTETVLVPDRDGARSGQRRCSSYLLLVSWCFIQLFNASATRDAGTNSCSNRPFGLLSKYK